MRKTEVFQQDRLLKRSPAPARGRYNESMKIKAIPQSGYEEVWEAQDAASGFHAYIALHNLRRGPALGGVRFWQYRSPQDALDDVLRLARSMTYKAAVAALPHGGGKGVILKPKGNFERHRIMENFAEFIDHLEGRYITAKDVGTDAQDMALFRKHTRWVTGLPEASGGAGDPSPLTAYGVRVGIEAAVSEALGQNSLRGIKVAIQGLGGVGAELARLLDEAGCEVWASDLLPQTLARLSRDYRVKPVLPEMLLELETDVLAPCALGQVLNQENIPRLKTKIVAGGANDPLTDESRDAASLRTRSILYAPDFVINAGGLIHVAMEITGYDAAKARAKAEQIGPTLKEVFAIANTEKITTLEAAKRLAEMRLS